MKFILAGYSSRRDTCSIHLLTLNSAVVRPADETAELLKEVWSRANKWAADNGLVGVMVSRLS